MKKRVYRIVRNAVGEFRRELDKGTRLLVFIVEPFSGELQVCWPVSDVPSLSAAAQEVVKTCLKRERSVVIHSHADPLMQALSGVDFEAALAVPMLDCDRNVVGIIYSDSPQPSAFSNQQRLHLEQTARGWTQALPTLGQKNEAPSPEPPAASQNFRIALAVTLISVVFFGVWLFAPEDRPTPPQADPSAAPTAWVEDPSSVVSSFDQLLLLREYEQAWALLDPELQQQWPVDAFKKAVQDWLGDSAHHWDLSRRSVRMGEVTGATASVYLDPAEGMDDLLPWEWTLQRVGDQWRISQLPGGPLSQ